MQNNGKLLSLDGDALESVHSRIESLMNGRTGRECAHDWDVPHSTLVTLLHRRSDPKLSMLLKIANAEDVTIDWLAKGGVVIAEEKDHGSTFYERIIEKPKFNVVASAGGGSFIDTEVPVEYYPFSYSYLKRRRLLHADLCVIEARGESMEPTIEDGDDLLLKLMPEPSSKALEGVYVVNIDNQLRVKRLEFDVLKDGYRIISDNRIYPEEFIDRDDLERMKVIGEVAMVMGKPSKVAY